jgi:hypothetical protein
LNLTWYQGAFINHIAALHVPAIVIGGKARQYHYGEASLDLDLWMPTDNSPASPVQRSLLDWSARYPNHSWPPLSEPMKIDSRHIIQFPNADVWVLTDAGEVEPITSDTRIDILFGLEGFEFDTAFSKAVVWGRGGNSVRVLSEDLIGPTAALKAKL